jgi:aminoglycoside N3'-acetyltransferase
VVRGLPALSSHQECCTKLFWASLRSPKKNKSNHPKSYFPAVDLKTKKTTEAVILQAFYSTNDVFAQFTDAEAALLLLEWQ